MIKGKAAIPGTLNKGLINLFKILPIKLTTLVCDSKLVKTKKGKREGTTHVAQIVKPFVAAVKLDLENITKKNAITTNVIGKIFLLKIK